MDPSHALSRKTSIDRTARELERGSADLERAVLARRSELDAMSQTAERFLVVLPTFNEAENLPRIIPMILAQDARLEILVVDDDSPDGTGELAEGLAANEPALRVLRRSEERRGRLRTGGRREGGRWCVGGFVYS